MTTTAHPSYVARRQDDGTWSIVESKTVRVADIGGCVLRRSDSIMAAGLAQDLNDTVMLRPDKVVREPSDRDGAI